MTWIFLFPTTSRITPASSPRFWELEDHAAAELTPRDLSENVVVKIADEVEVDVSTRAWKATYAKAISTAQRVLIEGVEIPFVALPILIASKETQRDQDQVDVRRLRELLRREEEES
jgi:hypothetical protein